MTQNETNQRPKKILVAEDDTVTRMVIVSVLKSNGYLVEQAENGRIALDLFNKNPDIDLIVTDLNMPEITGMDLIKSLRDRKIDLPIIILSGNEDLSVAINALKSGANDYILKEKYAQEALIPTVQNFIEKEELKKHNEKLTRDLIIKNSELKKKNDMLEATFKERDQALKQLKAELSEAAQYVRNLLPEPISNGDIYTDWRYIPSTSLGGDAFGYHWIDKDNMALYLLDVAGHGVGSALLSVTVMNVLRSDTLLNIDFRHPSQVLSALNNNFQMEKHNNLFFSIFYGVYNQKTREFRYAEGGHPPGLLYNPSLSTEDQKRQISQLTTDKNTIIGILPDYQYEEQSVVIEKNSHLYLYSDGVFEINLKNGSVWSYDEFIEFMSEKKPTYESLMDRLFYHTRKICNAETFDDDFSILEIFFK